MPVLTTDKAAALYTGHTAATIQRWAREGRITRYIDESERRGGVRYDLQELHSAQQLVEDGPKIKGAVPDMPTVRRGTVVTTREMRLPYGRLAA